MSTTSLDFNLHGGWITSGHVIKKKKKNHRLNTTNTHINLALYFFIFFRNRYEG